MKKILFMIFSLIAIQVMCVGCDNKDSDSNTNGSGEQESNIYDVAGYEREGIGKILGVPKGCRAELATGASGLESIMVDDSEISVPDTDKMDIAYFSPANVGSSEKKRIAELLLEKDEGIYERDISYRRKSDIERDIEYYRNMIELSEEEGDTAGTAYMENELNGLLKQLPNAPEEYPEAGDYSGFEFLGKTEGVEYMLRIYNGSENGSASGVLFTYGPYGGYKWLRQNIVSDSVQVYSSKYYDLYSGQMDNAADISMDEAEDIARDFMAEMGIEDVGVAEAADLIWEYRDYNGNLLLNEADGYYFKFLRLINGVQTYNGDTGSVDNLQFHDKSINIPVEEYIIYISDNKVIGAKWNQVIGSITNIEENVKLLSYDEIMECLNQTAYAYYERYLTLYKKIKFNDVRLTYYLIGDADGKYKYIPAWVFSQYDEAADVDNSVNPVQLLVVNAVDGTVIDLVENSKALGTYMEENGQ